MSLEECSHQRALRVLRRASSEVSPRNLGGGLSGSLVVVFFHSVFQSVIDILLTYFKFRSVSLITEKNDVTDGWKSTLLYITSYEASILLKFYGSCF